MRFPLDRSLELLPLFRLSDSTDDSAISYSSPDGGRWRAFPAPGDRVPGTFDQDVYVELMRRYHEAGAPSDGGVNFTLHAFLRAIGRAVDGRSYEQLRGALGRLERTTLESQGCYHDPATGLAADARFTVLSSVTIERRRNAERDQLALFPGLLAGDPGEARATLALQVRANLAAGHTAALSSGVYRRLESPVARRLYRLLAAVRHESSELWRVPLEQLAELLPLAQRYPSHLRRVLQPAHTMLAEAGVIASATAIQDGRVWMMVYAGGAGGGRIGLL